MYKTAIRKFRIAVFLSIVFSKELFTFAAEYLQ